MTNNPHIPGDARNALKERVSHFRSMGYAQLAIEMKASEGGHLEVMAFESSTGQQCQLVIDCCYDDTPGGAIRVDGTVMLIPMRPLLGFLPVFLSKACDGFVLTREGAFLGEDG